MRHYFVDASAMVKAYTDEAGHRRVRDMIRSARAQPPAARVLICDLCLPETASALAAKKRIVGPGRLAPATHFRLFQRACMELRQDPLGHFAVVLASGVMDSAAHLVDRRDLRAGDAVQLAAALKAAFRVLQEPDADFVFVAADRRLLIAAAAEGLTVEDPA